MWFGWFYLLSPCAALLPLLPGGLARHCVPRPSAAWHSLPDTMQLPSLHAIAAVVSDRDRGVARRVGLKLVVVVVVVVSSWATAVAQGLVLQLLPRVRGAVQTEFVCSVAFCKNCARFASLLAQIRVTHAKHST